jgi:hypothetical protein
LELRRKWIFIKNAMVIMLAGFFRAEVLVDTELMEINEG